MQKFIVSFDTHMRDLRNFGSGSQVSHGRYHEVAPGALIPRSQAVSFGNHRPMEGSRSLQFSKRAYLGGGDSFTGFIENDTLDVVTNISTIKDVGNVW
jgi:hypothetical protein